MPEPKYIIVWKDKATGVEGESLEPMSRQTALAWIAHCKKQYPEIEYWLQEVEMTK